MRFLSPTRGGGLLMQSATLHTEHERDSPSLGTEQEEMLQRVQDIHKDRFQRWE